MSVLYPGPLRAVGSLNFFFRSVSCVKWSLSCDVLTCDALYDVDALCDWSQLDMRSFDIVRMSCRGCL